MSGFEATIRIKINSLPLEGELADDFRNMLAADLEHRLKSALNGQDDYGTVTVNIEDNRPRNY